MIAAFVLTLATIAIPPTPTHYVTDSQSALSSLTRESVESELHDFDTKTGNQVILWIGDSTGSTPLEAWTAEVGQHWKIGHKGTDRGAILFLFMRDRKVRIEVGYGLESTLTDATSAHIINDTILPSMRHGDIDGGVQGGVDAMLAAIDPAYTPAKANDNAGSSSTDDSSDGIGEGIAALVVGLIVLAVFFAFVVTIVRRGKKHGDWLDLFLMSSAAGPSNWTRGGGFSGFGGGGGGFSAGGGSFGGGGASGSW